MPRLFPKILFAGHLVPQFVQNQLFELQTRPANSVGDLGLGNLKPFRERLIRGSLGSVCHQIIGRKEFITDRLFLANAPLAETTRAGL